MRYSPLKSGYSKKNISAIRYTGIDLYRNLNSIKHLVRLYWKLKIGMKIEDMAQINSYLILHGVNEGNILNIFCFLNFSFLILQS